MKDLCSLCGITLPAFAIKQNEQAFCCSGCCAVFNILSTKNELDQFQNHPIFKQAVQAGLISNPLLLEELKKQQPVIAQEELQRLYIEITEMWCPACAELIRLLILQEKGVQTCVVDYATDLAAIEYSPRYIAKEKLFSLISSFGYHPKLLSQAGKEVSRSLYIRFIIASFCSLNIMMFSYPIYASYFHEVDEGYGALFAWLSALMALPILTYCCWPILRRFLTSLRVGYLGMETLVIIGVATSAALSFYQLAQGSIVVYFDSLSVIVALVLLGKIIESKAKFSAKETLLRLARAMPVRGRKQQPDGSLLFVPLKEIVKGDIVHVYQGEKIVLDGVVTEGKGACNESLITGEAMPIGKAPGATVIGGSILQNGAIAFEVSRTAEESTLFKIVEMIQKEVGHKSVYTRTVDLVVRWFVPWVMGLALFSAFFAFLLNNVDPGKTLLETALIRALSVLLISCPCAIGIAVPLVESYVIHRLASLGAIVRNRNCLTTLGKENVILFDKTGTVTEGCFSVLEGVSHLTVEERSVLKSLTKKSTHAISTAIFKTIEGDDVELSEVEEIAGKGIRGFWKGEMFLVGSERLLEAFSIPLPPRDNVKNEGRELIYSQVYFSKGLRCLAKISLGDRLRKDAAHLIHSLKTGDAQNMRTILLSGDSNAAVARVAHLCGFDEYYAEQDPLQKREFVEQLRRRGNIVCMVGDGINDALALNQAHVAISVVSATDISIQVSDILLTTEKLSVVKDLRMVASLGQRVSQENLFFAFVYNVVGLGLAAAGYLSPLFAAFAMMASSFTVLWNARKVGK